MMKHCPTMGIVLWDWKGMLWISRSDEMKSVKERKWKKTCHTLATISTKVLPIQLFKLAKLFFYFYIYRGKYYRNLDFSLLCCIFTENTKYATPVIKMLLPQVCVRSAPSSIRTAFTVCNEICNINHYYLSCDLDVDIEIEEQIYHCLIWVTMHAA